MTTPSSIEERIAHLEGSFEQIERRLGILEQDVRSLRAEMIVRFDRLDARFDRLDSRIDRQDTHFGRLDSRIDRLDTRIDRLVYWQLGLLGAVAASIVATLLTRFL